MKTLSILLVSFCVSGQVYASNSFSCVFKDLVNSKEDWLSVYIQYDGTKYRENFNRTVGQFKIDGEIEASIFWGRSLADVSLKISKGQEPVASLNSERSHLQIFSEGKVVAELKCGFNP